MSSASRTPTILSASPRTVGVAPSGEGVAQSEAWAVENDDVMVGAQDVDGVVPVEPIAAEAPAEYDRGPGAAYEQMQTLSIHLEVLTGRMFHGKQRTAFGSIPVVHVWFSTMLRRPADCFKHQFPSFSRFCTLALVHRCSRRVIDAAWPAEMRASRECCHP